MQVATLKDDLLRTRAKRMHILYVRISDDEHEVIVAAAGRVQLTQSEFVRLAVRNEILAGEQPLAAPGKQPLAPPVKKPRKR